MFKVHVPDRLLGMAAIVSLSACGGGGASGSPAQPITSIPTPPAIAATPTPVPTSSPVPTPSPTQAPVVLTPSTLNFTSLGSTQSANVSESSYFGTFAQTNTCAGIATVSALSADTKGGYDFNVASQSGGTCTVTFADAANHQGTLTVMVTSANIVIMGKHS